MEESILIVEDEITVAKDIRLKLERFGYSVVDIAASGIEAIEQTGIHSPSLVLMDIMLQGEMDGIEAAQEILLRYNIPVVFLTAFSEKQTVMRATNVEPYGFVLKPFRERELTTVIEMALYRHGLEMRLRESEETARALINAPSGASVLINTEGVIVDLNEKCAQQIGKKRTELIGASLWDLLTQNAVRRRKKYIDEILTIGEPARFEEQDENDGNWYNILVYPIYNPPKEVTRIAFLSRNITSQKLIDENIRLAKEAAEAASLAKSNFLANMSHELRTPLNSILGFAQFLNMQKVGDLNDKQVEYVDYILRNGEHLLEMVNDILDLSKVEAGKLELDKRPFDLNKMLSRSPSTIKSLADSKSLTMEINIKEDLGIVEADEIRLKQVIYNLLSNAIKFTEENKRVGIDAFTDGNNTVIKVWDEGRGIPQEDLERIFAPFEQVRTDWTNKPEGTGLGLSISEKIIKLHGGTIKAESKIGEGSCFTISLPSEERQNAQESITHEVSVAEISPLWEEKSLLIVEDNEMNQKLIKTILDSYNFTLTCVYSGKESLKEVEKNKFDLILMDIQLPDIDGTDVMKKIRNIIDYHVPIIALTACAMKGDRDKFIREGFDDYIPKPIDVKLFLDKIIKVLKLDNAQPAESS